MVANQRLLVKNAAQVVAITKNGESCLTGVAMDKVGSGLLALKWSFVGYNNTI